MKCERCGNEGAKFKGYSSPESGPSARDAENTPDNLPGGFAWLCTPCFIIVVDQEESKMAAEVTQDPEKAANEAAADFVLELIKAGKSREEIIEKLKASEHVAVAVTVFVDFFLDTIERELRKHAITELLKSMFKLD